VLKVPLDLPDLLALKVLLEILVLRDPLVQLVTRVLRVRLAL
jgi:hypothetical protein